MLRNSLLSAAACLLLAARLGTATQDDSSTLQARVNTPRSLSVGYIVYPGFTMLDVFGPLELLFQASFDYNMTLSVISHTTGPITARVPPHSMGPGMPPMDLGYMIGATVYATHTFADAPPLDILLVPGGLGVNALVQKNDTAIEKFVQQRYPTLEYLASVCTGSGILANAGVLSGKRATTNKAAWAQVVSIGSNITWVPSARWVQDGNIWTSSGVAAGIDMTYALLKHIYGAEKINPMMNTIEYAPHTDAHWDPFSVVHNVPGADKTRPLKDCTGPVE